MLHIHAAIFQMPQQTGHLLLPAERSEPLVIAAQAQACWMKVAVAQMKHWGCAQDPKRGKIEALPGEGPLQPLVLVCLEQPPQSMQLSELYPSDSPALARTAWAVILQQVTKLY